ncbi:MAG: SusD/RagB family nutrient-binding outer membrane lipoprotein [Chitinophagaceae bacterium]
MKQIINYSFLLALVLFGTSCDKGFDNLNTNKVNPTQIDPLYQLNNAVVNASFPGNSSLAYDVGIVQQIISPNNGVLNGANFNSDNRTSTQAIWQNYYRNVIRNTNDVIVNTKNVADRANLLQMGRIFQAFAYIVLTDEYGDIPYTQGGKGYTDQNYFPVYDAQQAIYTDIIKELGEAATALNASGRIETGDILYGGNVAQWKKFAYSLMLRAGMRLSKADATKAQATVQAAFAGGVILANADNALIRHDANYTNPIGATLNSTEAANFYLTKPFVDSLKNRNDPRLQAIAVRYAGATSGGTQTAASRTTVPAQQFGLALGFDNTTANGYATSVGRASFYDFSQADRTRIAKQTAPCFLVTAAQTQLLLAEARQKGWITTGTVQGYYDAGVTLHMQQMAIYDAGSTVAPGDITTYLTNNPFEPARALEQIGTQYWIASFLNGPEAFANYRRTGFPSLAPNPYPAREVTAIRRLTYPNSEQSVNSTNFNAAITRQGADKLDTRVWWDKP